MKRNGWKKLVSLVYNLCKYYKFWQPFLPTDLPSSVANAMLAIDIACTDLIIYDKAHKGGRFHAD
jgi:hypothetical protein